ncbi:MAG: hypothetical protein ACRDLN_06440 [Solirubrobacteraceae bacterium]
MQVEIPERFQPYFDFRTPPGEARVSFGDPSVARGTVARVGYYESPLGSVFQLTAIAEDEHAEELDAFVEGLGPVAFEAAAAGPIDADAPAEDGRLCAELLLYRMRYVEPDSVCVALDVTLVRARDELVGNAVVVVGVIDPSLAHNECHGYIKRRGTHVSVVRTRGTVSVYGVVGQPRYANVNDAVANGACYVKGEASNGSDYDMSYGWHHDKTW